MSGSLKTKIPCGCGHNRWKTKGDVPCALITEYGCRKCGFIRRVSKKMVVEECDAPV